MRRIPIMCAVVVLTGCGSAGLSSGGTTVPAPTSTAASTTVSTSPSTTDEPATTAINPVDEPSTAIYLLENGVLHVVGRSLGASDPVSVMQALVAGPASVELGAGISSALPPDAKVLGVSVEGSTAHVNLSADVAEGAEGDLTMRAAQVVYTLTALPGIHTVEFAFDGVVNVGFGRPELNVHPLGREQFTDGVLPLILLETPLPYAKVSGEPLVLSGAASTFEATVNYKVLDPHGTLLVEGVTMATCGTGCWGTFHQSVALPAGAVGPFTVQVFDYSSKDGSVVDLQQIVVT